VAQRFRLDTHGKATVPIDGPVRFGRQRFVPGTDDAMVIERGPPTEGQRARARRLGTPPPRQDTGWADRWGTWSEQTFSVVDGEGRPMADVAVASGIDVRLTDASGTVTLWTDGRAWARRGQLVAADGLRRTARVPATCRVEGEPVDCDLLPVGTWYRRPTGVVVPAWRIDLDVAPVTAGATLVDGENTRVTEGLLRGEELAVSMEVPRLGRFHTRVPMAPEVELPPDHWGLVRTRVEDLDGWPVHRVILYGAKHRGDRAVASRDGEVMMLPGATLPFGMAWDGGRIVLGDTLPRPGRPGKLRDWCSPSGPGLSATEALPADLLEAFDVDAIEREPLVEGRRAQGRFRFEADTEARWPGGLRTPEGGLLLWGTSSRRAWTKDGARWVELVPCP